MINTATNMRNIATQMATPTAIHARNSYLSSMRHILKQGMVHYRTLILGYTYEVQGNPY